MKFFGFSLAIVVLASCSKTNPAPTNDAAPSSKSVEAAAPAPVALVDKPAGMDAKGKLKNGKVVEYRSAVVYQYQGSPALHIVAGTNKVTCAEVTNDEAQTIPADQDRVEIVVAPLLKRDGTYAPAVMQGFHLTSTGTESGAGGKYADVRLEGDVPTKIVRATVSGWKAAGRVSLELEGTIVADGCGIIKGPEQKDDAPPQRPQTKLMLEIAGKKLDVRGAIYWPTRNRLQLSTRALGCSTTAIEEEAVLFLDDDGSSGRFGGMGVEDVQSRDIANPPKIEIGKAEKDIVPMKINGKFEIDGYSVKLSGSAELLSCD
jgi:hypothetical protein